MKRAYFAGTALALCLTLGLCRMPAMAANVTWREEPADWAAEQMEDLADGGILGQGTYDPTATMTRGQFCYFMVNLVQRVGQRDLLRDVAPMPVNYFDDVTSTDGFGGRQNVYTAAAYGLTEGAMVGDQRLAQLDSVLTREQAAKMMCSLLDALRIYTGLEDDQAGTPVTFLDADTISPWAEEYVDRASALGILKGDDRGNFNPQGILTFQEACVMLDRAFLQGEEASVLRDESLSIRSFQTALEEPTDWTLEGQGTQMYWLKDGGVLRIQGSGTTTSGIQAEYFDGAEGHSLGIREIPVELSVCAAFYEGEEAYYLAFGQSNMEENDGKEVYRIVKYDKNWNRLASASVKGGESYTTQPYRSTSHTALTEDNGTLILYTARLRYQTADGLRHQSNITIKVRSSDMSILEVSPRSPGNHVSHSFAQYVAFDGGEPVYADHGDAYPRGFALNLDRSTGYGEELNFFSFAGEIGDNTTNAIPGGLGISTDNYLFAGASSDQRGNDKLTYCNAFLAVVSKAGYPDNSRVDIRWLTNYPKDGKEYVSNVKLVPMNNNTFVVMWQTVREDDRTAAGDLGDFCYAVFDGEGDQVGETRVMPNFVAPLNDPTVMGDRIVWVRPEYGPYSVFMNGNTRYLKCYVLEIDCNEESSSPQGSGPVAPKSFRLNASDLTFLAPGELFDLRPIFTPTDAVAEVTWRSSDPNVASVAWNGLVTAVGKGTCTVTATVEGVGSRSCTFRCNFKDTQPGGTTGPDTTTEPGGTQLPADGITDRYYSAFGNGQWLELELLDGDTVRLRGCIPSLPDYYNYVVLQVYGKQAEVPFVAGEDFEVEVTFDAERFKQEAIPGQYYYINAMVCQNHRPGDKNLAGLSFEEVRLSLTRDDEGACALWVIED